MSFLVSYSVNFLNQIFLLFKLRSFSYLDIGDQKLFSPNWKLLFPDWLTRVANFIVLLAYVSGNTQKTAGDNLFYFHWFINSFTFYNFQLLLINNQVVFTKKYVR